MTDPTPWLDSLAGTLSARDERLLKRSTQALIGNILQPLEGETIPWAPFRGIMPSPTTYRGVWNWDAAFHAVGAAHWDAALAREQIKILLEAQLPSGALPDVIFADGRVVQTFGKPPVMPWAAAWVDRIAPDDDFLAYAYPRFVNYEAHWRRDRCAGGLFHYDAAEATPEKSDEHARLESGWDNSVRWDAGCRTLWSVDLNGYMVLLYRALAFFAWRLGKTEDKGRWEARGDRLAKLIRGTLWDEARGSFLDRFFNEDGAPGAFSPVYSPACFMPLYVQAASTEQADAMAQVAADPGRFFPGMPTVSYDDPQYRSEQYWRGPTWLNTAYFAAKGLKDLGYAETAETIRQTVLDWCAQNEDALYEYYDSRDGTGLGARSFGWTAAFVICFILDWNGG